MNLLLSHLLQEAFLTYVFKHGAFGFSIQFCHHPNIFHMQHTLGKSVIGIVTQRQKFVYFSVQPYSCILFSTCLVPAYSNSVDRGLCICICQNNVHMHVDLDLHVNNFIICIPACSLQKQRSECERIVKSVIDKQR